jgi:hypothetical protein
MHDHVVQVDQHPPAFPGSLDAAPKDTNIPQSGQEMRTGSFEMAHVPPRGDQKTIGKLERCPHIENFDVVELLRVQQTSAPLRKLV